MSAPAAQTSRPYSAHQRHAQRREEILKQRAAATQQRAQTVAVNKPYVAVQPGLPAGKPNPQTAPKPVVPAIQLPVVQPTVPVAVPTPTPTVAQPAVQQPTPAQPTPTPAATATSNDVAAKSLKAKQPAARKVASGKKDGST